MFFTKIAIYVSTNQPYSHYWHHTNKRNFQNCSLMLLPKSMIWSHSSINWWPITSSTKNLLKRFHNRIFVFHKIQIWKTRNIEPCLFISPNIHALSILFVDQCLNETNNTHEANQQTHNTAQNYKKANNNNNNDSYN